MKTKTKEEIVLSPEAHKDLMKKIKEDNPEAKKLRKKIKGRKIVIKEFK